MPPKTLFWHILCLLAIPFALHSQSLETARQLLESGNCTDARQQYQELLGNRRTEMMAKAGLACVYADPGCSTYDPGEALVLAAPVKEWYKELDSKDRRKAREDGYPYREFKQACQHLADTLLHAARAEGSVAAYDSLLQQARPIMDFRQRKAIASQRNRLAVAYAVQSRDTGQWKTVLDRYSRSMRRYDGSLYDSIPALMVQYIAEEGKWEDVARWQKAFPDHPMLREPSDIAAYREAREAGSKQALQSFLQESRGNPWAVFAEAEYERIKVEEQAFIGRLQKALKTIQDSSAAPRWAAADTILAYAMKRGFINQPALEDFLQKVPSARVPQCLKIVLDDYLSANTLLALEKFEQRYPDYPNMGKLELQKRRLRSLARRGKPLPDSILLERLRSNHRPEYWPSADVQLAQRVEILERELLDSLILNLQAFPPGRALHTLRAVAGRMEDEEALFAAVPGAKAVATQLSGEYEDRCQRTFSKLQQSVKPLLENRDWSAALEKARRPEFAEALQDYPAYQQFTDILSREETAKEWQPFGGPEVNSELNEITPVLSPDEREIYFCRSTGSFFFNEEAMHKAVRTDSGWVHTGELAAFNSQGTNTAPLSMTADGQKMLIFSDGILYYSERTADSWSAMKSYPSTINGSDWQGISTLSTDGQVMIFSSRGRADSEGDIDLYISFQKSGGQWQEAINLGTVLNTPFKERSPFLHPDNRTLYFSSDGHGGFGGLDVYKTVRLDDTWLHWSTPQHLGRYANTVGRDWCYKINTTGSFAYFSADPQRDGTSDLFSVELSPEAKPEPVTVINTQLLDADGKPLEGQLVVEDAFTGEVMAVVDSDAKGKINMALPQGRTYRVLGDDGTRMPYQGEIYVEPEGAVIDTSENIVLKTADESAEAREAFELRNIFFNYDDSRLLPESEPQLQKTLEYIKRAGKYRIEISGHTDSDGEPDYNRQLSERRAQAVRRALIERGIPAGQLIAVGYGEDRPVADNSTEAGKARNRRVEIRLIR